MKHMHQNSKFLENFMQKVHEQLKMRMKFCTQRVNQSHLVLMLLEYIEHQSKVISQKDKQNICSINSTEISSDIRKKDEQISFLKQQMKIEAELTKRFFNQVRKQAFNDASLLHSSYQLPHTINQISPNTLYSSIRQSQSTPFIQPFSEVQEKVNTSPVVQSIQLRSSYLNSGRSPRVSTQSTVKDIEHQREKSKTFARLRKVQAMFCQSKKASGSRRKSSVAQSFNFANKNENKGVIQENQNLKAIQNNLVTHLEMQTLQQHRMQKYKNNTSIEELVQKQEKLRRKELQLKQLEQILQKRERNLNKSHIQVLKRQKSIKML